MQNSVSPGNPGRSGSMLSLSESIGTPKDISISATPKAKIVSLATHAHACGLGCLSRSMDPCVQLAGTKLVVTYARANKGDIPFPRIKWISSRHHFSFNQGVECNCKTADATVSASSYLDKLVLHTDIISKNYPGFLLRFNILFFYTQAMNALTTEDVIEAGNFMSFAKIHAVRAHKHMLLKFMIIEVTHTG